MGVHADKEKKFLKQDFALTGQSTEANIGGADSARRFYPKRAFAFFGIAFVAIISFLFVAGPPLLVRIQMYAIPYSREKRFAVYMDNGQVFYAAISGWTKDFLKLTDIYFPRIVQLGSTTTTTLERRMANEGLSPQNYLLLNRQHIMYLEELGNNSQVVKTIKESR